MDILSTVREALTSEAVQKISGAVGESPQNTQAALRVAVPAILSGLLGQATGGGSGLSSLTGLLSSGSIDSSLLGNIGSLVHGSSAASLMETGKNLLKSVFGDKLGNVQNLIASQSGIQASSASTIMALAGPMILAAISKLLGRAPTGAAVANLLGSQRTSILDALPAGLGDALSARTVVPALAAVPKSKEGGMKLMGWLLLALLGVGLLAYFLFNGGTKTAVDTATSKVAAVPDAAESVIAALGEFFQRKLPNGVELNIPKFGIENRIVDFIEDSSKPVDKTTWFDFDRLVFETGKSTLQPSSQEQLANLAAILKAYPKVHVKIGGYTDNSGDQATNLKLSADRANSVMNELVTRGVDPTRLSAEGYGQEHPIADNATNEGRAKNRRVSMRVVEK